MVIKIIAAIGQNNELGVDNHLIWDLPGDRRHFKSVTNGHTVVMGRKTFESLPTTLDNRKMIVISSRDLSNCCNIECYRSIENFVEAYHNNKKELYVIGGATLYDKFINYVDLLDLTEIHATYEKADAFFPNFDKNDWCKNFVNSNTENGIYYEHVKYVRKKEKR